MLSEEIVVALAMGIPSLVVAILALIVAYLTYRHAAEARVDRIVSWPPVMPTDSLQVASHTSSLTRLTHPQTLRRRFESSFEDLPHAAMLPPTQPMRAEVVHHDVQPPPSRLVSRGMTASTPQQPDPAGHCTCTIKPICILE